MRNYTRNKNTGIYILMDSRHLTRDQTQNCIELGTRRAVMRDMKLSFLRPFLAEMKSQPAMQKEYNLPAKVCLN